MVTCREKRVTRYPFVLALFAAVPVVGCQGSGQDTTVPPVDDPAASTDDRMPVVGTETRLPSSMDEALGFRNTADLLTAHVANHHDVAVDRGVLRIAPYRSGAVEPAMAFETEAVVRGDVAVTGFGGQVIDPITGRAVIDRGTVLEQIENFEGGVEQSWEFSQPPAGTGDLVIHVAAVGRDYVTTTSRGLHFGATGKLGFRYSHATWVDATGDITPIAATWSDGGIVLTVPEDVLADTTFPAVLDPIIDPEIAVDNPVIGWTGSTAQRSTIASNGSGFLVAWSDGRNASPDIFGTRLSATGANQDNLNIAIDESTGTQDDPAAAFVGSEYVVVWDDGTNIDAARVSTAGAVTPLPALAAGGLPKIAARGAEALAVWTTTAGDVRASRFSGGSFGAAFTVATGVTASTAAVAANPGGDYLVVWSQGATAPDLRGQLVTAAGGLGTGPFDVAVATGGQKDPDASWNGTDYVVVYNNSATGDDIYGTRVSTAGVTSDLTGKVITAATSIQNQPSVACASGGVCLATWSDRRAFATNANDIYAIRLDGTLTAIGAEIGVAVLGDEQRNPAVAAIGSDWRVSWHDKRHGGFDAVFTAGVLADGSTPNGSGANIVSGNNHEVRPAIKASTNNWLVTWSDSRVLGSDIMAVRYSSSGTKLDATARTLSNASGQQGNPALTFDGTNYLGAWNDTRNGPSQDLFAGRMDVSGNALDGSGFQVAVAAGDQRRPSLATSAGGVTLAVWQDGRSGQEIYGALISGGSVTMADIPICAGPGAALDPAVAYDATNDVFLVVWNDDRTGEDDVYATRVSSAGAVTDGNCGVSLLGAQSGAQTQAQATAGGGQFYVTWTDSRTDAMGDIYGTRVGATSAPAALDGSVALATGAAAQSESDVQFVQPNLFVVVWTDGRNVGSTGTDIFGQSVLTTGQIDGPNFIVSQNPEDESGPAIAAGPAGKPAMVAYEKRRTDIDAVRVVTRRVTFKGGLGTSCSLDSACTSGFCRDGRCCDSDCGGGDKFDCEACSIGNGAQVNGICSTITDTSHVCRGYASTFCDVREFCDGVSTACPPDLGRRQGIACTTSGGSAGVCPANDVTGAPHVCQ